MDHTIKKGMNVATTAFFTRFIMKPIPAFAQRKIFMMEDKQGNTFLCKRIETPGQEGFLELALKAGIDPLKEDSQGRTLLDIARAAPNGKATRLLEAAIEKQERSLWHNLRKRF